jgi:CRP/FNR family transcriptional regulator, cyclic AMP receptor protein
MNQFDAHFTIVAGRNCPLYQQGERLHLTDRTISCPQGKEVCLILVRDMTALLFQLLPRQGRDEENGEIYSCSGCSGLIKFRRLVPSAAAAEREAVAVPILPGREWNRLRTALSACALFRGVSDLEPILGHFREVVVTPGGILFRRGEQNLNLYLVAAGELCLDGGGVLGPGEVCGEMSYLGPDLAVATVWAREETRLFAIAGDLFGRLLGNHPGVQAEMARLLASRLRRSNAARADDLEACMSGRIAEIVPAELLQIFHMHQKTGVLSLELPGGVGRVAFREGCIINASYGQLHSQKAIFAILAEKEGLYRFTVGLAPQDMKAAEIGDFMMLLMEGIRRVDEGLGGEANSAGSLP